MPAASLARLAQGADRCVACGLCVPICPTWQATANEVHSPRGRIMIMSDLAAGGDGAGAARYLDSCLGCGACDRACPNDVPFTAMLPHAKAQSGARPPLPAIIIGWMANKPGRNRALGATVALARLLVATGAAKVLPGPWREALATASLVKGARSSGTVREPRKGGGEKVRLFVGCFGPALEADAIDAATTLMGMCGYEVVRPAKQGCCGAIASHIGDLALADKCGRDCERAFAGDDVVVSTASGCAAHLQAASGDGHKHLEAGELIEQKARGRLRFLPSSTKVLVHLPCTQQSLNGRGKWVARLLWQMPGAEVSEAPDNATCCGAGGLTWMGNAAMSRKIADRKAAALAERLGPETVVVSANHACRLHISAALRRRGLANEVRHPLSLAMEHIADTAP